MEFKNQIEYTDINEFCNFINKYTNYSVHNCGSELDIYLEDNNSLGRNHIKTIEVLNNPFNVSFDEFNKEKEELPFS